MKRFFNGNAEPHTPAIGDPSLEGEFTCNYCGEPCAQRSRFQVYQRTHTGKGCFCTPECSTAFVLHRCPNIPPDEKEEMFGFIRTRAGRNVVPAPPPVRLARQDPRNGLSRAQWLPMTRKMLSAQDADMAAKELVVQTVLI